MITEDYVSFEIAKLLKERGFDEPCYAYWHEDENRLIFSYSMHAIRNITNPCFFGPAVPTLQMAVRWLREVHHIFITIEIKGDPRKEDFIYYKWSVAKYCGIAIDRIDNNLKRPEDYWIAPFEEEETYERTCEAAIKYCLENLI